jgi:hypothetical protein
MIEREWIFSEGASATHEDVPINWLACQLSGISAVRNVSESVRASRK